MLTVLTGINGGKEFKVYNKELNYTNADKECYSSHNNHLAKIKNVNQIQLVKNRSNTANGSKYWMGLQLSQYVTSVSFVFI